MHQLITMKSGIVFFLFVLILAGCSPKISGPIKPDEKYLTLIADPAVSQINVPLSINVKEIENALNKSIKGDVYIDNSMDDNGGDNLMLKATKSNNITLKLNGDEIQYFVPLKLWVKKGLLVGSLEADGEIGINFSTKYQLNPDWSFLTTTKVVNHKWIQAPKLKTGIGDLPISFVANLVLDRSKAMLEKSIDDNLKKTLDIKSQIQNAWNSLQVPVLVSQEYQMWMKNTPQKITLAPIITMGNKIDTHIGISTLSEISMGEKPMFRTNTLMPPFEKGQVGNSNNGFNMNVYVRVPFLEAESIAKKYMLGQTFASGNKSVTIQGIKVYGQENKLVVATDLTGSYVGKIFFIGRPTVNGIANIIEVKDLDFELGTKNFLLKSAAWLFKGEIAKKMKSHMQFPFGEQLNLVKDQVQSQLSSYKLSNGVTLKGSVGEMNILEANIVPEAILVRVNANGIINLEVKDL
jgi:hypothetical protein